MIKTTLSTSKRAIFGLVWPQILMMYLLFITNIAPLWVAGKMDAQTQAALGLVMQVIFFLNAFCIALNAGATAVISQSMGANRFFRARLYVNISLALNFILGALLGFLGLVFKDGIFELLAVPNEAKQIAHSLWEIMIFAMPCAFIYQGAMVIFRCFGDVITPLFISACISALNVFLCTGLAFGYFGFSKLGFSGIGFANVATNVLGCALCLILLLKFGFLKINKKGFLWLFARSIWLKKALPYLFSVALNSGANSLIWQGGNLTLFAIVASTPIDQSAALAGFAVGNRIESFLFTAATAFNMSAAVLVGNCVGKGDFSVARRVSLWLVGSAAVLMSILAILLFPFRTELSALLSNDKSVIFYSASYLAYNFISTPFSIASTVFAGVMVGAGAAKYNLFVFSGTYWLVRIPLAIILAHFVWGDARGVFGAMLISQIIQTAWMSYIFASDKWLKFGMKDFSKQG